MIYSWNVFRYTGDYMHVGGICVLMYTIARNKSVAGLSMKTQLMYFILFVSRYLDLFTYYQARYLVIFKVAFILTSFLAVCSFAVFSSTYDAMKDSMSLTIIPTCFAAAVVFAPSLSLLAVFWTFSELLEGFALLPQYIYCFRDDGADFGETVASSQLNTLYICAMGGYRACYVMSWIYRKYLLGNQYSDVQSWIGGGIELVFFLDFLYYKFRGGGVSFSVLRTLVLKVDDKVNDMIELTMIRQGNESEKQHILRVESEKHILRDPALCEENPVGILRDDDDDEPMEFGW